MGAAMLHNEVFAITQEEAKVLSEGVTRVSEQYDVPFLDEKTRAWLNLAMAMGQVYGTRVAAVVMEKKKKAPAPPPMVLTPFRTPPPPPAPPPVVEAARDAYQEAREDDAATAAGD